MVKKEYVLVLFGGMVWIVHVTVLFGVVWTEYDLALFGEVWNGQDMI